MPPLDSLVVIALASLAGLALLGAVWMWSWRAWLAHRRTELAHALPAGAAMPSAASRIELADLRERVKKLEAIAAGVDF